MHKKKSSPAASAPLSHLMRLMLSALLVLPLLTGCASSGFYNMNDDWCGRHLDASENRCPGIQPRDQRTAALPGPAAPLPVAATDRKDRPR